MAPSRAEILAQWQAAVDWLDAQELAGASATPNLIALQDVAVQAAEGDYAPGSVGGIAGQRARVSRNLSVAGVREVLDPILRQWGAHCGAPNLSNVPAIVQRFYQWCEDQSETVNSRDFTFSAIAATAGNTGTGVLYRLTTDVYAHPIEGVGPDSYTANCIEAGGQGLLTGERFEVLTKPPESDSIKVAGSGFVGEIYALSTDRVSSYLRNPSFLDYSGTGATLDVTGWTLSSAALFAISTAIYFHGQPRGITPVSLQLTDNGNLYQNPVDEGISLPAGIPMFHAWPVYRADSCDGTLVLQHGSVSRSVSVSGLNNSAWNLLLVPATPSEDCWFDEYEAATIPVKATLGSRTTGSLYFGDVMFAPFTYLNGHWYALTPGATAFARKDQMTWSNTEGGTRARLQYWLWRGGYGYLPSNNAGAETFAD